MWTWNDETKEYDAADPGSDDIDALYLVDLRNDFADNTSGLYASAPGPDEDEEDYSITALFILGLISLSEYESEMRKAIQDVVIAQWALSKGGIDALTDDDKAAIEEYLLIQFSFLSGFMQAIFINALSDAEIYSRARLYFSDTIQAYEQGRGRAHDAQLVLPYYPADCSSECCAGDRCYLLYTNLNEEIFISWVRTVIESCPTCIKRAACPDLVWDKRTAVLTGAECWDP